MQRNLKRLANERFDLLVIGGGIVGACIARDAAMRGLKVTLVEKNDFAHATSAHNSKLIHGGLRYLRNLEFGLVRQSLRERRIWQSIAPHLVQPLPFLIPVQKSMSGMARAALATGLALYDILAFDRTWLDDPAQRLPGQRWLGCEEALTAEPVLEKPGFEGAYLYYDAQMYSPERLALECVLDADAHGAAVANYLEAEGLLIRNGAVEGALVRDRITKERFDIQAAITVFALGPWTDLFLDRALNRKTSLNLTLSKGIHLVLPVVTRTHALTVATKSGHFFVLPWRGHTILGTTDTRFDGAPDNAGVSEQEIESFLTLANAYLPGARLSRENVQAFYAGLRPLVRNSGNTYRASRRSEFVDHDKKDGVAGLYSAIGGKWTTARALAEHVVSVMATRLGANTRNCATAYAALPGGNIFRIKDFIAEHQNQAPDPPAMNLARLYGSRLTELLSFAKTQKNGLRLLGPHGDIEAQVLFAIREEMAMTIEDVILRRTGVGQFGSPDAEAYSTIAVLMQRELGWSDAERDTYIGEALASYRVSGV